MKQLALTPEEALASDQVDGIIVALYEDERPLQGLAARMDWRLRGALSRSIEIGKLVGKPGEIALVPLLKHGKLVPLLLAGAGPASRSGERRGLPAETVSKLRSNLGVLGTFRWALSQSDLGSGAKEIASQYQKREHSSAGGELWLTQ